MSNSVIARLFR